MKVGSIFLWEKFEQEADVRVDGRLFIYFGRSPLTIDPVYAYITSTTAKTEYYRNDGKYSNNNIVWFKEGECNFERECVLDFDRYFYPEFELDKIVATKLIGIIPENKLKSIYEKIYNYKKIKLDIRMDMHSCLNRDGVSGLRKPK